VGRWATFDCYGTLVDWNAGIGAELERLFGVEAAPRLLARYHELEPDVQAEQYRSYAEVLTLTLERVTQAEGVSLPEGEGHALVDSLPHWPVFSEAPQALDELRRRGWQLAILSNSDRNLIVESEKAIGVPFDLTVVAEDVGSYKPAHGHWKRFLELTTADRDGHVHVAQSHFHDIVPTNELGIPSVWINRLGEKGDPPATAELSDLHRLPDTLDELLRT
jgi:2-haloacid dehalogenase